MTRRSLHRTWTTALAAALVVTAAACGGDDGGTDTTTLTDTVIDPERCAQNRAAGTITYASSFDFSASASILDVIVAEQRGYFDAVCLDVDLVPGFSTTNYPLVTAGQAQFSSAGNFTEILNFSTGGAEYVALLNYGKSPIEALLAPAGGATSVAELRGGTIGVKGDIPPSIVALLASNGLRRGADYRELPLEGFDPQQQLRQVDALPVYKSNEPGQLERAGIDFTMFDPTAEGIPGTFGLLYTSRDFAAEHPTVVEDFTRAALRGMEDAIADPVAAVAMSVAMIDAAGNQFALTEEGETYRWTHELEIVLDSTPDGEPVGLIDPDLFRAEYDAYVAAGVWPDGAPEFTESYDPGPAAAAYGPDGRVRWG